jgi:CHAT domain-containing protein/Tfp pilus assembly protein PilF
VVDVHYLRANAGIAVAAWLLSLAMVASAAAATAAAESFTNEAQQRLAEADQFYRREGPEAALPVFQDLAATFQSTGDPLSKAIAIGYVGEIYWRLGDYLRAGEYLEQALTMKRASGDRLQESKTLNVLGLLHWDLGEFGQAQAYFREGAEIAEEMGDKQLQGAILNNLSLVHDELGDYYVSLEQYQQVLDLYRGTDFPRGEGDTLGNIGGVYLLLGRFQEALDHYQRALAISEQLDSAISMSQDHGNIGLCYLGLGQTDPALGHLGRAIELSVQAGMQQDEAFWLGARGNAQLLKGRYDLALEDHRAALALYEEIEGKTESVEALQDMGRLYLILGDSISAENHYRRSMELAREIGLARGVTGNLLALGDLQFRQGQVEAAAELYGAAVERAKESGEMVSWSEGLLRLTAVHRDQQRLAEAAESSAEALEIAHKTGAPGLVSQALYEQAELLRLQRMPAVALAYFDEALAVLAKSPDPELKWQVLYGKGLTLADAGNRAGAISALESAVALIEGVRDRLHEERFKAGYVQDKYQVYVDLVRLQLEAGHEQQAFSTAERLRARSYLELIDSGRLPLSVREQPREFMLQQRIRTLREALAEESDRGAGQQRQLAIEVYSQELLAAEREYQAFLDDRRQFEEAPSRAQIPSYREVSAGLAEDEALIEYVVGRNRLMVFLLKRDTLSTHTVAIRREDVENKVALLRNLIGRRNSERWTKPASSLAGYLIKPVLANGQLAGIHHLYVVPHGGLNYLPFAVLPGHEAQQSRRLIEDFTLAYLPTAAALVRERKDRVRTFSMLAVAPEVSRLEFAVEEAAAVHALFQPDSRVLLGASATESAVKELAPGYRVLHLATHGFFNKLSPMLSGLQLEADVANDGRLELHEILGLQLDADLVTLSACQTGLGSGYFAEIPAGDDYVALTRAFLSAGTTTVLATLWEVDDASTLELMKEFYGGFRRAAITGDRAIALAQAQRRLLASENYRHPYHWAPFVLAGRTSGHSRPSSI